MIVARKILIVITLMMVVVTHFGCKKDEMNLLKVSTTKVEIQKSGGTSIITIETNANSWNIFNPASDWIELSSVSGSSGSSTITLSVSGRTLINRNDTLIVTAGNAVSALIIVSQPSSEYLYNIQTDRNELNYEKEGSTISLNITTEASSWNLSSDVEWLQISQTSGANGTTTINVTAPLFDGVGSRKATITLSGELTAPTQISVTQMGNLYPDYNTSPLPPDASGMTSTAVEIANNIIAGINIGNTLEAIGGETNWGNPKITNELIQLIKNSGFNAIRLPCSWDQYSDATTAEINLTWLNRVKEVVQYCINNDMYVILNIHWDGGWLENNCTTDKQKNNNAKQKAFWQQIATQLRDFDEHLMFAGSNEPNVDNTAQMEVLMSYHQTFIDAVRSTGGRNSYRVLIVQGPSTDIEKTNNLMTTMPTDETANRLMAEIHYYTPYQYCLMSEDADWGKMFYYWGAGYHSTTDTERNATWGEESDVDNYMGLMKTRFVDNGIPVIMGEFAVARRLSLTGDDLELHLASRAYYLEYVTRQAKENGILPFYWDAGGLGDMGSGLFNRTNLTIFDQQALDALIEGATK